MCTVYADVDNMKAPRTSPWSVLRSRAYLIVLAARFASLLGDFFNYVAVAWLGLELTGWSISSGYQAWRWDFPLVPDSALTRVPWRSAPGTPRSGLARWQARLRRARWVQRRTDPRMQGRVMSLVMLASVGLEPPGLALRGLVASRNLGLLFWGAGALIVLTGFGTTFSRAVGGQGRPHSQALHA
jgi:hypothetical protein